MVQAKHKGHQAGLSLVQSMVVSLLLTGASVAVVRNLGFSAKSTRTQPQVTDLDMLDFNLRESLSCENTLNAQVIAKPTLCTGSYILRFHDGTPVLQVFGQGQTRARCPPGGRRLLVDDKETNPADATAKEWRPLCENTMSLCQHLFPGFSCPAGQSLQGSLGGMPSVCLHLMQEGSTPCCARRCVIVSGSCHTGCRGRTGQAGFQKRL